MQKTLILIRHAHRDNSHRELDNGLTDKGKDQAKAVRRFFTERFSKSDLSSGLWLVSSPKARCVETLEPLSKAIERPVDRHPGLDEQGDRETPKAFLMRIQAFLQEWKDGNIPLTVACSHGDWLPLATRELLGFSQAFKKGAWYEVQAEGGLYELRWYIPTFKYFFK